VDFIFSAQSGVSSGGLGNGDATNQAKTELLYGVMENTNQANTELLYAVIEKKNYLACFRWALPRKRYHQLLTREQLFRRWLTQFWQGVALSRKIESDFLGEAETDYSSYKPSYYAVSYYDDDNNNTWVKRAKHIFIDDTGASSSQPSKPWTMGHCAGTSHMPKVELEVSTSGHRANIQGDVAKPPFFLYGNVVEIPKDT